MKNRKILIIIIIMLISIGFAYISTSLNMIGDLTFKESRFDIHFEDLEMGDKKMYSADASITDTLAISTSGTFDLPGDYYEFTVYLVNDGTVDVAIDEITVTGIDEQNRDYLTYYLKYVKDDTDVAVNIKDAKFIGQDVIAIDIDCTYAGQTMFQRIFTYGDGDYVLMIAVAGKDEAEVNDILGYFSAYQGQ